MPRHGCELWDATPKGGEKVGLVTSGTKSPTLGKGIIAVAQIKQIACKGG